MSDNEEHKKEVDDVSGVETTTISIFTNDGAGS